MPRVPTYDNYQVQQNQIPNIQVRPPGVRFESQFSQEQATRPGREMQQMGNNVMEGGAAFARVYAEEVERANQVRVNDAMNKAAKARLELTYSPEAGYVNLRGEAALKRPGDKSLDVEYTEKLQSHFNEIAKGLGNDEQRARFKDQSDKLLLQFQGNLSQHVSKEFVEYQVGVQDGTIQTAREQMALSWSDPNAIQQGKDAIKAAVYEKGRMLGLSAKQVEAGMTEALSPAHAAVISSAVDSGNVAYAKEYLKQYNTELTPQARLQLTKVVDAGDFEQRTQQAAGELWAKFEGDPAAALAEARQRFSGKDEDAIVTRIKTLDSERVALRERAQKDAADKAWGIYARSGSLGKVPASVLAAMDGKDLEAIRRTARADAEGKTRKTDPSIYYALTMAAAMDPNFKNEDLRRYSDKLSPSDFKHFVDMQGKAAKPGEIEQVATANQQKEAIVKALGLEKQDVGVFHQVADKALFAAQAEKGRNLTQEERQKVLDRLVLQGTTPGSVWGTNKTRAFQAQAEGRPFTPVWDDTQKRQATAALQRQGVKNPTAQQVDAVLRATYQTQ